MAPCSFLISSLLPRGQTTPLPQHTHTHASHNTLSILGPLTSSEWWSNLKYTGKPAKRKTSAGVTPEQQTASNQYLPSSPLRTCWRWWETSHLVLLCCYSNQVLCLLRTRRQLIVGQRRVNRDARCICSMACFQVKRYVSQPLACLNSHLNRILFLVIVASHLLTFVFFFK